MTEDRNSFSDESLRQAREGGWKVWTKAKAGSRQSAGQLRTCRREGGRSPGGQLEVDSKGSPGAASAEQWGQSRI